MKLARHMLAAVVLVLGLSMTTIQAVHADEAGAGDDTALESGSGEEAPVASDTGDEADSGGRPVPEPQPSVGCYQNSCTAKGPVATHCDDTGSRWTTEYIPTAWGSANVSFMYSTGCRAFWARALTGPLGWDADFRIRIEKRRSSDNVLLYQNIEVVHEGGNGIYDWTLMAGAVPGSKIRACVEWQSRWKCTPYWS